MRLGDVASVCRTKNAGAFLLTIDVVLPDEATYRRAIERLTADLFAELYQVPADQVHIAVWDRLRAIKATIPRWMPAGGPGDRDVFGCQQHAPLLDVTL